MEFILSARDERLWCSSRSVKVCAKPNLARGRVKKVLSPIVMILHELWVFQWNFAPTPCILARAGAFNFRSCPPDRPVKSVWAAWPGLLLELSSYGRPVLADAGICKPPVQALTSAICHAIGYKISVWVSEREREAVEVQSSSPNVPAELFNKAMALFNFYT